MAYMVKNSIIIFFKLLILTHYFKYVKNETLKINCIMLFAIDFEYFEKSKK
ncbi:hypothetical protein RCH18_000333 [Flavobacterium sp. PL11]|nr:hypothetical protein [Flavobacterium sp. PL11]